MYVGISAALCFTMPYKGFRGPAITPFSYADWLPKKEEIPCAALAARRASGWSEVEVKNGRDEQARVEIESSAPSTPCLPCLEPMKLVTEAGEVLTKRRRTGPMDTFERRHKAV